ncbi:hypothetical protein CEE45_01700 [Candidatus Heimdallarchaeota archaeon B3_Heim]|nr:MAG: hypothetical protein CEE45_01700 [Candidatus Heimdallarchaeota archaeon B3_Heim]
MLIQISREEEKKLRHELEFLKSYRDDIDHILKYFGTLHGQCGIQVNVSEEFRSDLNKIKMAIIKEIGRRRENYRLLGIQSRFPRDL